MNYIGISKPLIIVSGKPSINACYGPWASREAAHAEMVATYGENAIPIGTTVGVLNGQTITEYWYNGGRTINDLVRKLEDSEYDKIINV